jgi:uncharacterized repeat protein (TIGR02059 family)
VPKDTAAPVLQTAEVNATSLVLTYGEALDGTSPPGAGDFSIGTTGDAQSVAGVAVSGATVTLTLSPGVALGDAVTVSYTAAVNPIQDAAGNDAANLVDQAVTNNTSDDSTPPTVVEVLVSGSWSASFLEHNDPARNLGFPVPVGNGDQLKSIPWTSVTAIHIVFSEAVYITVLRSRHVHRYVAVHDSTRGRQAAGRRGRRGHRQRWEYAGR